MSDEKQFEKRLKKLKSSYHEMPSFSSIDRMTKEITERETMQRVHENSNKKKWVMIGSTAAALFVGFIFILSTMFSGTDEFANESVEMAQDKSAAESSEGEESTMQTEMAPVNESQYHISEFDRPLIKRDTIQIEGSAEEKIVHLYASGELGLSTYYPDDMEIGIEETEIEKSVTFFTTFNDKSQKNTLLRIQLLPTRLEQSMAAARKYIEKEYESSELTKKTNNEEFYLSEVEYQFAKKQANETVMGWISIFTHHHHIYIVTVQYVPEMGEGLQARTDYILHQMILEE
jgi:hypothetical protein